MLLLLTVWCVWLNFCICISFDVLIIYWYRRLDPLWVIKKPKNYLLMTTKKWHRYYYSERVEHLATPTHTVSDNLLAPILSVIHIFAFVDSGITLLILTSPLT